MSRASAPLSLSRSGLFAVAAIGCAALLILPLATRLSGHDGLLAATLAAGCCLTASLVAFILVRVVRAENSAWGRLLVGMLVRMAIPLFSVAYVLQFESSLADAGFVYYTLVFYAITLAVDTLHSVRAANENSPSSTPPYVGTTQDSAQTLTASKGVI